MILKPKNLGASFTYSIGRGRTKTVSLPLGTVVEVDFYRDRIAVRNFWSGAYEKWNPESEDVWIKLTDSQMDNLMSNRNFKEFNEWKPCI